MVRLWFCLPGRVMDSTGDDQQISSEGVDCFEERVDFCCILNIGTRNE